MIERWNAREGKWWVPAAAEEVIKPRFCAVEEADVAAYGAGAVCGYPLDEHGRCEVHDG